MPKLRLWEARDSARNGQNQTRTLGLHVPTPQCQPLSCLPACLPASGKLGGKGLQLPHSRWGNCPDPTSWFEGTPMGEKWDHLSTKKCHGLKSIRGLNPVNNNAAADNNNNNNSNKTHGKNLHLSFGGGWGTNSLLWNLVKRKKKAGGRIKPGASQRARPALPSTPPPFS